MTDNLENLFVLNPDAASPRHDHQDADEPLTAVSILHLAELVPIVRTRLAIDAAFPDDSILAALQAITKRSTPRERWQAAFSSNLGHWLALQGGDLHATLNTLVTLLPQPRS